MYYFFCWKCGELYLTSVNNMRPWFNGAPLLLRNKISKNTQASATTTFDDLEPSHETNNAPCTMIRSQCNTNATPGLHHPHSIEACSSLNLRAPSQNHFAAVARRGSQFA